MRPLYGLAWGWALAVLAASGSSAHAAWNNVFQVCCNSCGAAAPAPVVANYGAPAASSCDPCPQPPVCTTRYVQRSYYQPVTSYRTSYYYEPVTTYRTSYYYEPSTCYRYSCYYDPCTCSYQSVAVPSTSYQLKSRCCPVTSYLQRTCMTPVTSYQQSFYYEPVTSCCTPTSTAAAPCPTTPAPVAAPAAPQAPVTAAPPATTETRDPIPSPPPGTEIKPEAGMNTSDSYKAIERNPGLSAPRTMPPAAYRNPGNTPRTPVIRLDRIASLQGGNLQGKVVNGNQDPRSGAKVLLVSVDAKTTQKTVTTQTDGTFQAKVAPGGWLVYSLDSAGKPHFSRRIEVQDDKLFTLTVTQR